MDARVEVKTVIQRLRDLRRGIHIARRGEREPSTEISVEEGGLYSSCTAERGPNSCYVHYFDYNPEYVTEFWRDSEIIATGRTSSKLDTINAVDDWLEGKPLPLLYHRFPFVDQRRRALDSLRHDLLKLMPELAESTSNELEWHGRPGRSYLWFRNADRSCQIYFYERKEFPDAFFYWDECQLFKFLANNQEDLASVLKRWVCDRAMPSMIRTEFPEIDIGKLADYYESGNPIEGECICSWDRIEEMFGSIPPSRSAGGPRVCGLIARMRQEGYDRSIRADQSHHRLLLWRARRIGMPADGSQIMFSFGSTRNSMTIEIKIDGQETVACEEIEFTDFIDALLKRLEGKGPC